MNMNSAGRRSRRTCLFLFFAFFIGFVPLTGYAVEIESFGGWEGDVHEQGFGFISLGSSLKMRPETVLVGRAMGSFLYYRFDSANSTTEVTSPGVTLMLGPRFSVKRATALLLGGGELRWNRMTEISRTGITTANTEREIGAVAQGSLDAPIPPYSWISFMVNYGGSNQYTFGRFSLRHQISNFNFNAKRTLFLGMEGIGQGNSDVLTAQGGVFFEIFDSPRRLSLMVRGGYKNSWFPEAPKKEGSYLALNFYTRFR